MDYEPLYNALRTLSARGSVTDEEAAETVRAIDHTLRSDEAEFEWDDAWDAKRFIRPVHLALIPALTEMIQEPGQDTSRDRYARRWALLAAAKIKCPDPALRAVAQAILDERPARAFLLDKNAGLRSAARDLLWRMNWWRRKT